jgi:hypothetical protein
MHKIVNIQYTQEWFPFFVSIVRKIESVAFHEYAFLVLYLGVTPMTRMVKPLIKSTNNSAPYAENVINFISEVS